MERRRPSKTIDDTDQGVPLRNIPGRKIAPPTRAGQSHHGQPPEATDRDGATHLLRASCATTDLHHTDPTGGPGGARKEERPSGKVGLTSPFPVQNRQRTWTRRPSQHMENISASDKGEGATRLQNSMQRERTSSQMQSAAGHSRSGSPPPRTPLPHRRPGLRQQHSQYLHVP